MKKLICILSALLCTIVAMGQMWEGTRAGHEWVNLGLPSGTLWASCNVGANSPEEFGDYFAWGEVKPKEDYTIATYKWCKNGDFKQFTKYCVNKNEGKVDNLKQLQLADDAAYVNWGKEWRMPTEKEYKELEQYCSFWFEKRGKVKGFKIVGHNGASIFLPAGGQCFEKKNLSKGYSGAYWLSTLATGATCDAWILSFSYKGPWSAMYRIRLFGANIRPVCIRKK